MSIGRIEVYMSNMSHLKDAIGELNAYGASLRLAHWKADTKSNQHEALGALYDSMSDLTDTFAETYMGHYGSQKIDIPLKPILDVSGAPVRRGCEIISYIIKELKAGQEDDLINIAADMQGTLNKARYLLKEPVAVAKEVQEVKEPEEEEMDYKSIMQNAVKKMQ